MHVHAPLAFVTISASSMVPPRVSAIAASLDVVVRLHCDRERLLGSAAGARSWNRVVASRRGTRVSGPAITLKRCAPSRMKQPCSRGTPG